MWKITVDHDADKEARPGANANAVGVCSPDYDEETMKKINNPWQFRMYDDDDNLVYEGIMDRITHAPLDDFGMPNYGCTYMTYFEDGEWKHL